ncbi:amidase [Antarctobacter sp.]|uniref:amidase n=1 Tax=Antarctobacter sp. TaxID=1872577 RepID=UPI002B272C3A|nr:amidase [Antarctobacter sp.]
MNFSAAPFVSLFKPPLTGGTGPLSGLRVAVKDNFDIAGHVTGCGNPEWAQSHPKATSTALLVTRLLDLGAEAVGKTQMDELAYSLMGQNARYGTPVNPVTPDRMPGGSSSGSAVAVASGAVEIGLGTDTGGSVRLPAAFCGTFGWRPTHGLLPADGLVPLAQSYDVPGFMTRDAQTLALLAEQFASDTPLLDKDVLYPGDLWRLADTETTSALLPRGHAPGPDLITDAMRDLLLPTFRICQGAEVADNFRDWIAETQPDFGPGILQRFEGALALSNDEIALARQNRAQIRAHLTNVISDKKVIALPTAPGPAPFLTVDGATMETYRNRALTLLSLAGHAGLPQVSIPMWQEPGLPVGLSLIGPPNSDRALIKMASQLHADRR